MTNIFEDLWEVGAPDEPLDCNDRLYKMCKVQEHSYNTGYFQALDVEDYVEDTVEPMHNVVDHGFRALGVWEWELGL